MPTEEIRCPNCNDLIPTSFNLSKCSKCSADLPDWGRPTQPRSVMPLWILGSLLMFWTVDTIKLNQMKGVEILAAFIQSIGGSLCFSAPVAIIAFILTDRFENKAFARGFYVVLCLGFLIVLWRT